MNITSSLTEPQVAEVGETDIVIRRDFAHPPGKVWRALTEPYLIRQWLAPREPMTRCEMDARAGGSFHYEWADFFFFGSILTFDAPHRMTHIERFSGDDSYRVDVATELAAHGTGTRMTVVMRYADAMARASAVAAGFTDGLTDVYGRIESLPIAD